MSFKAHLVSFSNLQIEVLEMRFVNFEFFFSGRFIYAYSLRGRNDANVSLKLVWKKSLQHRRLEKVKHSFLLSKSSALIWRLWPWPRLGQVSSVWLWCRWEGRGTQRWFDCWWPARSLFRKNFLGRGSPVRHNSHVRCFQELCFFLWISPLFFPCYFR